MLSPLGPSQRHIQQQLEQALPLENVFVLSGSRGLGKTTLLHHLQQDHNALYLSLATFTEQMYARHPLSLEEAFDSHIRQALQHTSFLLVDDLHLLSNFVGNCGFYPRAGYLETALSGLVQFASQTGKKLLFCANGLNSDVLHHRAAMFWLNGITAEDYAFFCQHHLGSEKIENLDFARIHRFAPSLNLYQLEKASRWVASVEQVDTESFIEYLRNHQLVSNVDLSEVQQVDLRDLHGVDKVLESLETHVILPLENDELAAELSLKPKRGVLLLGPPGTGKTTVGRALAHRLRGKFFLIDGTVISGTGQFYGQIHHIFHEAKLNAPSVIFIDDSDVIFESGEELGLYRYLLTMLDGLESNSAGRVCVMLTAMDVSALPPALLRSGRVELWLQMELPNQRARLEILTKQLSPLPERLVGLDIETLAQSTDGFTGADLKRLAEDGKNLLAYDLSQQRELRSATDYFMQAIETLRDNKLLYANADAQAREQRPQRPVYYDVHAGKL